MRRIIKLRENELRRIISESVKRVLIENNTKTFTAAEILNDIYGTKIYRYEEDDNIEAIGKSGSHYNFVLNEDNIVVFWCTELMKNALDLQSGNEFVLSSNTTNMTEYRDFMRLYSYLSGK